MLLVTLILSLLPLAIALPELTIRRQHHGGVHGLIPSRLARRTGTLVTNPYSVLTWSSGGAYYVNVTIGTPPQEQVVILDTGSSDSYFDASNAPACRDTASRYSCRGGTFNSGSSSSYRVVDPAPAFNTRFQDGSTATGPFATDTFSIGDVTIENVQFGLAEELNSTTGYAVGLMGVGYSHKEATFNRYPNVPEVLREAGVINSRLYSVYLNNVNTGSGSILFGGVDRSKFRAPLVTVNLLPSPDASNEEPQIDAFITTVTELEANVGGKSTNIFNGGTDSVTAYSDQNAALAVLLDTGASAWLVPTSVYTRILERFSYVDSDGLCACSHRNSGDTLTLTFANKLKITVPAQEFIVPIYDQISRQPIIHDSAGTPACSFMISEDDTGSPYLILGDAVLRSMYVVFDLDNGQVSMAQAVVNSTEASKIVTISAGVSGVASAISGVSSAALSQTWSIAAQISATRQFVASRASSTIGTATGIDAVPTEARPASVLASLPAPAPASSSTGAGYAMHIPAFSFDGSLSIGWAVLMFASGAALMY